MADQMKTALVLAAMVACPAILVSQDRPRADAPDKAHGEIVSFPSGTLTLKGVVYRPEGKGPFPAVVYNHGSAGGMLSQSAFDSLGPVFARRRWVFFGPYRRGQGLSAS